MPFITFSFLQSFTINNQNETESIFTNQECRRTAEKKPQHCLNNKADTDIQEQWEFWLSNERSM